MIIHRSSIIGHFFISFIRWLINFYYHLDHDHYHPYRHHHGVDVPAHASLGLTHERGHLEKIHLVNFFDGVVVALGAGDLCAHEDSEGVRKVA